MNSHEEFNQNMQKLMHLLGKILKSQKNQTPGSGDFSELFNGKKNVNLNVCIFALMPMAPEEMDELEDMFEDLYVGGDPSHSHSHGHGASAAEAEMKFELTARDVDFLRKNGIRF
ncbi:MAG: hypothetical protein HY586_02850 [Candidatus Omnitrophica bacterium]|nr:hypothetical protein [Candidatus Omnitrophota bacterium]